MTLQIPQIPQMGLQSYVIMYNGKFFLLINIAR